MPDSKPTNVLEALRACSAAIDHITKDREAKAGGTYAYRGIEDVLEACHDPFIEYGIVVAPGIVSAESVLRMVPGRDGKERAEYEAQLHVSYRVYGPGGPQDFIDCQVFSTGLDSGDKSTGKAMSYAYKNLMFQLLCIPTAAAEDNEASAPPAREPVPAQRQVASDEEWEVLAAGLRGLDKSVRDPMVATMIARGHFNEDRTPKLPMSKVGKDLLRDMLEADQAIVQAAARSRAEVTDTVGPLHPEHAVATLRKALGVKEGEELPDVDPAFWYLAEYANADEIDWKAAAKALNITGKWILDAAKDIALARVAQGAEGYEVPTKLDDILGPLAVEVREHLIQDSVGEPY